MFQTLNTIIYELLSTRSFNQSQRVVSANGVALPLLKKVVGITGSFFIVVTAQAQENYSDFTPRLFASQVLNYKPKQRVGVTDAKFNYAKHILEETRGAARQDSMQLNVADYWNITSAFVALREPKSTIELAFKKAISLDASSVCSYIKAIGANGLDQYIPETFLPFYQQCIQVSVRQQEDEPITYDARLDAKLTKLLVRIHQQDIQFRTVKPIDWTRQNPLDNQNQQAIDSLYQVYHTYIGNALVGKSLAHIMWAVVQHSTLPMMERYLPVIQQAVQQRQLDAAPLKMLLDRICTLKHGKQLYGSQVGIPLADEPTRKKILKFYSLE